MGASVFCIWTPRALGSSGDGTELTSSFETSAPHSKRATHFSSDCSYPMQLGSCKTRGRGAGPSALFLLVFASLVSGAATTDTPTPPACSGSSLNMSCKGGPSASQFSSNNASDAQKGGEALLNLKGPSTHPTSSPKPAASARLPCKRQTLPGCIPTSDGEATPVSSVRLFYSPGEEQRLVSTGTLIDGRYLLVDLLHPRHWRTANLQEEASGDIGDLALQLRAQPQSPSVAASNACEESDNSDQWTTRSSTTGLWHWPGSLSIPSRLPSPRLLLPPLPDQATGATGGAALAAALVSVHSELVVARQPDERSEGFCIDPFIFLRAFPFWLRRPPLPRLDNGSSTSNTGSSSRRYKLFGRLGGGAYGEVWRAVSVDSAAPFVDTVLKRMRCGAIEEQSADEGIRGPEEDQQYLQQQQEQAERVQRGFAREVFFGLWLRGVPHVARFLEVLPSGILGPLAGGTLETLIPAGAAAAAEAAATAAAAAAVFVPEMSKEELVTAAHSAREGCEGKWLVFVNEGVSLTHLFFVPDSGGSGLLEPSALWWHLKASARLHLPPRRVRRMAAAAAAAAAAAPDAPFLPLLLQLHQNPSELLLFLRSLLQQLLLALRAVHRRQVTHRDVKLENVLLQPSLPPDARLADWGSAVSNNENAPVAQALKHLLGDESPSLLEETDGYQPPEVWAEAAAKAEQQRQQDDQQQGNNSNYSDAKDSSNGSSTDSLYRLPSYDMWGVGMIFLKLALGTPTPLEAVDRRRSARLARESREKPFAMLRRDLLVTTLGDLCLVPWSSDRLPTPATPTAVVAPAQHSFFSSLKSAVVSAVDGFYRKCVSLFCGDGVHADFSPGNMRQEQYDLSTQEEAELEATGNAAWLKREMGRERLFELLSRVRGEISSGELVVREQQQLAVQGKQNLGVQAPFNAAGEAEGFVPHVMPVHHHSDCNDALFAEILKSRDAAGIGVPNPLARDLLRKLLAYDPQERLTAAAALQHPWFAVGSEAAGAVDKPKNNSL